MGNMPKAKILGSEIRKTPFGNVEFVVRATEYEGQFDMGTATGAMYGRVTSKKQAMDWITSQQAIDWWTKRCEGDEALEAASKRR